MKLPVITVTLNPALDKTVSIPKLHVGGLNRVQHVRLDPGGKGVNVAKVLKGFDVKVTATGLVSGTQGQLLLKQLDDQEIAVDFEQVRGETRTNLKIFDEEMKITTEINEPGFVVSVENLANFRHKLGELLAQASILVLGGSLPPGVPEDVYRHYIEMANEKGVKTILDADGLALQEGIKAKPFAIKPNLYELEQLIGRKLVTGHEIVAAGRELVRGGISLLVISMGKEGAIVLNQEEAYRVAPFPINPQSTVGAGDSMVAALVYALLTDKSVSEIAIWTTTAGTVTASKSGTQVCTLSEVKQFIHQVQAIAI